MGLDYHVEDLYYEDRRHASKEGSKLAAQVIFDTLAIGKPRGRTRGFIR